ncbi:MAG: glycosyltransferase, partial [Alphaproteobacteria bacterium]
NGVDLAAIRPLAEPSRYRAEWGIDPGATVALYAGNLGRKQGLEVLAGAARRLAAEPGVRIVVVGDGPGGEEIAPAAVHLPNLRLMPLQPRERLGDLLGLADIHLLPQRADAADLVMPSKLPGMLASGRPVVAGARPGTALAAAVEGAGTAVPPDDPAAWAAAVAVLAGDPAARARLGAAARRRAEAEWDQGAILARFEAELMVLAADSVAGGRPID